MRHADRLRLARDVLSARGYDTRSAVLACYSGAGFTEELRALARRERILLIGLDQLYNPPDFDSLAEYAARTPMDDLG